MYVCVCVSDACSVQVATKLATQLLLQACPDDPAHTLSAPALEATQQLLRALDTHYPTETDTAVNTLLTETTKTAAGAAQARKSKKSDQEGENNESEGEGGDESDDNAEGEGDGQRSERAGAVFAFVQSVFSHTLHAPCGDQAMTLAAAATAPAAGLRLMVSCVPAALVFAQQTYTKHGCMEARAGHAQPR